MKNKIQDFMKKVSKAHIIKGQSLRSLKGGSDPPPEIISIPSTNSGG